MKDLVKDCSGVILAGGENSRMPVLKAFIKVDGQRIIERNLKVMKRLFNKLFIVTNQPAYYAYLGVPMLGDIYDLRGPMTGVFTALLNSPNPWVFITASDMPFLNKALIGYMASKRGRYDAVVPESPGGTGRDQVEPLFAFYSRRLLVSMEKALNGGKNGLKDFLNNKRVHYIRISETEKFDPQARSFVNLNTPEDIDLYLQPEERLILHKQGR